MVKMIMELVRNQSFTLTTSDSKQSRLRRLKNGVPQGSVLAPLQFNIYTYNLPSMISRKFAYADDLALLHSSGNWKDFEGTLSQDMSTLSAYLQTWRLKLGHTKMVMAAFHLNNRSNNVLWSRSPNQESPWGMQRAIDQYLCSVSPTRSSRGLSTPTLNPTLQTTMTTMTMSLASERSLWKQQRLSKSGSLNWFFKRFNEWPLPDIFRGGVTTTTKQQQHHHFRSRYLRIITEH